MTTNALFPWVVIRMSIVRENGKYLLNDLVHVVMAKTERMYKGSIGTEAITFDNLEQSK